MLEQAALSTTECEHIKVLLVEDDEDDYILVRGLLADIPSAVYHLDWVSTYDDALNELKLCRHDVYLLDYRLGSLSGLELMRTVGHYGCKSPIILLTGYGNYEIDLQAMKAGAADYLVKGQINAFLLERSIRYSIERRRIERQLRSLSSQLLSAQEEERNRIARELHDSIGSSLSAVKFGLETVLGQMEEGNATPAALRNLISITQSTIDETRRIMTDLRPSILDDLGIVATIGWFRREFQKIYKNIEVEERIALEEHDVPDNLKIVVFRLIQEAFHNAAKYSKAQHISICMEKVDGDLALTITDNGVGFDLNSTRAKNDRKKGLGLNSMRERTELSGGVFSIESEVGKGTAIKAFWPHQYR